MKTCGKCQIEKPIIEFNKRSCNKTGISNYCKKCDYEWSKKSYYRLSGKRNIDIVKRRRKLAEERNKLIKSLNLKCKYCGFNNQDALDFHHIDSKSKYKNVSDLKWSGCSNETFMNEIKKCEVLCANCHRIEHAKERNKL